MGIQGGRNVRRDKILLDRVCDAFVKRKQAGKDRQTQKEIEKRVSPGEKERVSVERVNVDTTMEEWNFCKKR